MNRVVCTVFVVIICLITIFSCAREDDKTGIDGVFFTNGEYNDTFKRNKELIISKGYNDSFASQISEILADAENARLVDDIELFDVYDIQIEDENEKSISDSYIVLLTERGTEYWVFFDHGIYAVYKDSPYGEPFYYIVE